MSCGLRISYINTDGGMETGDWGDPVTCNVDRVLFSGNLL